MTQTDLLTRPPEHDPSPDWGQSLSNGAAGVALLHVARARVGIYGWGTAHQWVTAMTRSPVVADPDACSSPDRPARQARGRASETPHTEEDG